MAELPQEVAAEARQVPILFEEECFEDPEILGHYGHFEPGEISEANGPIILYLGAIDAFCAAMEGRISATEASACITYLHESRPPYWSGRG